MPTLAHRVASRYLAAKYNQKGYKFYVVADGKIQSGWEYAEDAKDGLEDLSSGLKGKVLQVAGLKKLGLDPNNDKDWASG